MLSDTACSMLIVSQNCQNLSETKLVPMSDIIFLGIPYLVNIICTVLIRLSHDNPSNLFDDRKFAVEIYNAQIVFVIKMEYVCTDNFPWPEWYVVMDDLFLWLHLLKFKTSSTVLYVAFNISIYAGPVNRFMGK